MRAYKDISNATLVAELHSIVWYEEAYILGICIMTGRLVHVELTLSTPWVLVVTKQIFKLRVVTGPLRLLGPISKRVTLSSASPSVAL